MRKIRRLGYKQFLYLLYVNNLKKSFVSKTKFNFFKKWPFFHTHCFQKYSNPEDHVWGFSSKDCIKHSLDPLPIVLKREKINFDYLSRREESEKLEKGGGSMVQRQVLLKVCVYVCVWVGKEVRDWHFSYLLFLRFIIFTYRNYITLCKTVLCIWRETIFFCHHNFMKKGHSKLSKNEPENIP